MHANTLLWHFIAHITGRKLQTRVVTDMCALPSNAIILHERDGALPPTESRVFHPIKRTQSARERQHRLDWLGKGARVSSVSLCYISIFTVRVRPHGGHTITAYCVSGRVGMITSPCSPASIMLPVGEQMQTVTRTDRTPIGVVSSLCARPALIVR